MEVEYIAAISDAEDWFKTGRAAADVKAYNSALYSLEMAVEIAIKAVLLKLKIDVPKEHNILRLIESFKEEKTLSQNFIKNTLMIEDTFKALLEFRNISGYRFQYGVSKELLKQRYIKYEEPALRVVELCKKEVSAR